MKKIINVGVVDNKISYNAYLIIGEKSVLIDTVPEKFSEELINNINENFNVSKIDYVIINHTESDRSGALSLLLSLNENIVVISSLAGINNLEQQQNKEFNNIIAKSGMDFFLDDDINFKFFITHNLNWPDSMMVYWQSEKILFSCDVFSNKTNTPNGYYDYYKKHFYCMREYVNNAMKILKEIDISYICPGNGDVIENTSIIDDYITWSKITKTDNSFVILYESHTDNTKNMAEFIYNLIKKEGNSCDIIDVLNCSCDDILERINDYSHIIIGSPTHYRNIPSVMSNIIMNFNHYLMYKKKFCLFGSYGFSGEAPNLIYSILKARHFNVYKTPFRFLFKPSNEDYIECSKYIKEFIDFSVS